uniref:Uncharacterized protein n=1 Tax=Avena sativa TaxID=4498 RepID=A0ACD5UXR5_AVESA
MLLVSMSSSPSLLYLASHRAQVRVAASSNVGANGSGSFPTFLPIAVEHIRDGAAIQMAKRIERLPVQTGFSGSPIMSSCVRPLKQQQTKDPVVLLHGFDSSCLEWRYTYPLLEEAGFEAWAVDVLGWGFSDLETRPPSDVASKREHLYQFWRSYIKRPMVLVGPSLDAAVAIDFAVNYPETVSKLIFIGASVYAEGTGDMTRLPKFVPYAGVFMLKSLPLRLLATRLAFKNIPSGLIFFDWVQIGYLHCLLPWWEDATVEFMISGGYNVINQIKQRLHQELQHATLRQVRQCGHLPHVEKPRESATHVLDFLASENVDKLEQTSSTLGTDDQNQIG